MLNFLDMVITVISFIAFIALCLWAYHPNKRKYFSDLGQIPIEVERTQGDSDDE